MNYIVDFKDSVTIEEIENYFAENSITKIKEYSHFSRVYLVSSDNVISENDYIEKVVLDHENGIQLLGFDVPITAYPVTQTDSFNITTDQNWWKTVVLNDVDFDNEMHTFNRSGNNSTVYVLDSGIDISHPEFETADITLLHSYISTFNDPNGHGTALASLIAGKTCGITNAKIKVVKIFDSSSPTLLSNMLDALNAVASDYMNNNRSSSIVNCSWSIPFNEYVNSKLQQLVDMGMFLVCSSGNNGSPIENVTPACMPDALTIGSFGQNLTPSDFSNYTDPSFISFTAGETNYGQLDGWAPGEKIWAAQPGGTTNYIAGTSAATAIASAVLALNLEKYNDSTGTPINVYAKYNLHLEQVLNNAAFLNKSVNINDVYRNICLTKKDILDLSNPKYTNSFNQVVGVRINNTKLFSDIISSIIFTSGKTGYLDVFQRSDITRISSQNDLPEYLTLNSNGLIQYTVPTLDEPYIVTDTPISVHYADGSVMQHGFKCIVFRDDVNYSNINSIVPPNDPILQLTLDSTCYTTGLCGVDDCSAYLGPSYGCYPPGGKGYNCACQFGSDALIKENVRLVETIDGINLYDFNYKNVPNTSLRGVIAQELLFTEYKDIVTIGNNGYYVVNYCMLPNKIFSKCKLV